MNYKNYIQQVMNYISCDRHIKHRLKEDLMMSLINQSETQGINNPVELLGQPKTVALEIIDNEDLKLVDGYEYISSSTVMGVPFFHITFKQSVVAKGFIAIGIRSIGVFSFGILSAGIFSMGVLSLGLLLSIGSMGLSGILSLGAVAVSGYLSLGAVSISNIAIGAVAIGNIALGDIAFGELVFYKTRGYGDTIIQIHEQKDLILPALKDVLSNEFVIQLLKNILSIM